MYFRGPSIGTRSCEGLSRHPAEDYLTWSMPRDASAAVEAVYRSDWGRIVATLIRLVRDFDVAEEAAQEAFAAAVGQWRRWRSGSCGRRARFGTRAFRTRCPTRRTCRPGSARCVR